MSRIGRDVCAALFLFFCPPVLAQEATTPMIHRGLDLSGYGAGSGLTVSAVDIAIGAQSTTLKYRLSNASDLPLSVSLNLPLPDLDFSDPDMAWSIPAPDPVNFIGVVAKIDQRPAALMFSQSAYLDGADMSAVLRQHKLAFIPIGSFQNRITAMTASDRSALASKGLIAESGSDRAGNPIYNPRWLVRTHGARALTLAPQQTSLIELSFRTSVGISRDSVLREPLRSDKGLLAEVERHKKDYCLDRGFFGGVDKLVAAAVAAHSPAPVAAPEPAWSPFDGGLDPNQKPSGAPTDFDGASPNKPAAPAVRVFPEANIGKIREKRIVFDLGAGLAGVPVGSFRLAVDKGKPDYLVSFCLDNLKKISPTQFEMRVQNYAPSGVVKFLFLGHE